MESTLEEYIANQEHLVRQAAEAIPHQFTQCTYNLGALRQPVYLCITCKDPRGICAACSVACHTDHEQLELFPKRDFRCDCPTSSLPHPCSLHKTLESPNSSNAYGQNFTGAFCRCGREYDANTERETMIQCLACEDWFHESCCNLRERPSDEPDAPEPEPASVDPPTLDGQTVPSIPAEDNDVDDAASDASSSGLPPPLIRADDYDSFVCAGCVRSIPILTRYAGTEGCMIVVRDKPEDAWRVYTPETPKTDIEVAESDALPGSKRPLDAAAEERDAKRPRITCLAPAPNPIAQQILSKSNITVVTEDACPQGTGDVFLTEGFRERWCRCAECLPQLEAHSWLVKEDETYEPPEDPESGLSLEELGMRALNRLPRERAIDGIHAFNSMRDKLVGYLKPFAQEGKVVGDEDVKAFFEELREQQKKGSA
ncbi:hypothetical protein CYLTODRAFT_456375 [Cylindrobasidium torrendii FP15055 ss-10]|uniref:UBR-type domain-containing protein n=1 Tax=Cylindrobasidium torrendii FP15055 ss-10 TaxID=1314674 RepID=A0A0D7B460_9AGAR|nr:hypothetical protein CYLTODRAFT_456375 [Cylindrobasidium torrendii FP15055 ss-10]